jgi:hypothetical protein
VKLRKIKEIGDMKYEGNQIIIKWITLKSEIVTGKLNKILHSFKIKKQKNGTNKLKII